jgi:trehalose 6-phosphate phosphatase
MNVAATKDLRSRHILGAGNLDVLRQFAEANTLVGLDFDGTLAPLVSEPDRAKLNASTRALLNRVCRLYPTVLISGRACADLRRRVGGIALRELIGNHGLEPSRHAAAFANEVRGWLPLLERRLKRFAGVVVENKTYSLAVHYRMSRQKRRARAAIAAAAGELGLRVVEGHQVMNLLPAAAPHKGLALAAARRRLRCDAAIYVGDDETDEDVFGLERPGRLLGVRVGPTPTSRADYFLEAQPLIDRFLGALIDLRSSPRDAPGVTPRRRRPAAAPRAAPTAARGSARGRRR